MNSLVLQIIITIGILGTTSSTQKAPLKQKKQDPSAEDEMNNDDFIDNFDESGYNIACEWMALDDPTKYKLNLNRGISYEDVAKLTFLNKGKELRKNALEFPEDISWRRELINQLWSLFENACPTEYVNMEYMNVIRELVMIYLNSVEPRTSQESDVWTAITESLMECGKKDLKPYNFTSAGLVIKKLIISKAENEDDDTAAIGDGEEADNENNTMTMDLSPLLDNAAVTYMLDPIIDNLWQLFSHGWARCLKGAPSRELWGPRFKQLFFRDFLAPLERRWKHPGDLRRFLELIVGDFDVGRMQTNIPYCTEAAYINPGGTHLESQLIRPIKITDIDRGVSKFQNTKVTLPKY